LKDVKGCFSSRSNVRVSEGWVAVSLAAIRRADIVIL
jgi:hypothetical protein